MIQQPIIAGKKEQLQYLPKKIFNILQHQPHQKKQSHILNEVQVFPPETTQLPRSCRNSKSGVRCSAAPKRLSAAGTASGQSSPQPGSQQFPKWLRLGMVKVKNKQMRPFFAETLVHSQVFFFFQSVLLHSPHPRIGRFPC